MSPLVSIGVPVRNGEKFLALQLESLLAQDFGDLEIVISDNASTDATPEICRSYAARDARVRYHRTEENHGLAWNHNRTFELAQGRYFKWAAYDDEHEPTYVSKSLAVLDADPTVICCHSATVVIDDEGEVHEHWPARELTASPKPHVRLNEMLRPHPVDMMYGLMRVDALARTGLHRAFPESDHALLAELALLGRLVEVPEPLFRRRLHTENGDAALPDTRALWRDFTGAQGARAVPGWPLNREMVRIVARSGTRGIERMLCWRALAIWFVRKPPRLAVRSLERTLRAAGREDAAARVRRARRSVSVLLGHQPAAGAE
jgi:glycosyltransferase involved in cell wall biosynthesis